MQSGRSFLKVPQIVVHKSAWIHIHPPLLGTVAPQPQSYIIEPDSLPPLHERALQRLRRREDLPAVGSEVCGAVSEHNTRWIIDMQKMTDLLGQIY